VEKFGRLDVMFNNAGLGGASGPIDQLSIDAFDMTMAVLLRGALIGMKHAARVMKPQGSGSIISTASVAGFRSGFGFHTYSAAKAGIMQLTRTVAAELGEFGVRVNCICPGGVATGIFGKQLGMSAEEAEGTIEGVKEALKDIQPIKRSGVAEDVAKAALWLAGDDAGFVTGHALVVDGGVSVGRTMSETLEKLRPALLGSEDRGME
jgi:NAD(P)-dependent dehydrogenase (short-subunit alcohol dehydrogenase family)